MLKRQTAASSTSPRSPDCTRRSNGPHYAGYAASKAGLMGLTRELAASWGRSSIRVNAIAPGFFHSRLADPAIVACRAAHQGVQSDSAGGRRGRAERRRRVSRGRRFELHHRTDHRRRRRTNDRMRRSCRTGDRGRGSITTTTGCPHTRTIRGARSTTSCASRRPKSRIRRRRRFSAPSSPSARSRTRADRFATALARLGIVKGDRVGVMLPNCPQYLIAVFAHPAPRRHRRERQPALHAARDRVRRCATPACACC